MYSLEGKGKEMAFKYELVVEGRTPTWGKDALESFVNPVSVGDKILSEVIGSEIVKVTAIVHYPTCSVLYYRA